MLLTLKRGLCSQMPSVDKLTTFLGLINYLHTLCGIYGNLFTDSCDIVNNKTHFHSLTYLIFIQQYCLFSIPTQSNYYYMYNICKLPPGLFIIVIISLPQWFLAPAGTGTKGGHSDNLPQVGITGKGSKTSNKDFFFFCIRNENFLWPSKLYVH